MDKQQLLEFVQRLPDDAEAFPFELSECEQDAGCWESQHQSGEYGGIYRRTIQNALTLRLSFKTREQGEFRRTYEDPDGMFRNLRRIN